MRILDKGEKPDAMWGLHEEYITDEMIEALKKKRRLYLTVFDEYAVVIKYRKAVQNEAD